MAGSRQAELQRFVLPEVRPTGKQLGVGSYCVILIYVSMYRIKVLPEMRE